MQYNLTFLLPNSYRGERNSTPPLQIKGPSVFQRLNSLSYFDFPPPPPTTHTKCTLLMSTKIEYSTHKIRYRTKQGHAKSQWTQFEVERSYLSINLRVSSAGRTSDAGGDRKTVPNTKNRRVETKIETHRK